MHRHRETELNPKTYHGHWTMKLRSRTFVTYQTDMYTSIGIYISNIIDLPFIYSTIVVDQAQLNCWHQ